MEISRSRWWAVDQNRENKYECTKHASNKQQVPHFHGDSHVGLAPVDPDSALIQLIQQQLLLNITLHREEYSS
jgi:hypothetical protein